ncbi:hypothetical protein [Mammaliicoccus vitulinus]|uniref:hypothetical protein n=1 Tax=Mammaliicoccus vitulinus TaxID=71237 RepID=UPI003BA1054C
MQHSSKDGIEVIHILFNKEDVDAYKTIVQTNVQSEFIPVLYLASVWSKFQMFEYFLEKEIYLRETFVDKLKELSVDTMYEAVLRKEKQYKIKSYNVYQFSLTIKKDSITYVTIKQMFIEK